MTIKPMSWVILLGVLAVACQPKDTKTSEEVSADVSNAALLDAGQKIAMAAQKELGGNLMKALAEGGPEYALEFCSERALLLTDSMGLLQNAKVKRVSDQNRNPLNLANESELAYIREVKGALANGQSVKGQLNTVEGSHIGYYPIVTNGMCLQCHGQKGQDILPSTLEKIEALYPEDLAVGYGANELRGIWVVELPR
jgi:hypothetical protein